MKTVYQAEDGTLFDTEEGAKAHEEGAFDRWLNRTGLAGFLEWDGLNREEHEIYSSDLSEANRVIVFLRQWCKTNHFKIQLKAISND